MSFIDELKKLTHPYEDEDEEFERRRKEAAQRIRLVRIIEKMEKNPAFSNKLGMKNTSEYLAEKEQKK